MASFYELEQVKNLNGYATRLYELLICWRSTGFVPVISLNDFRSRLGILDNEYKAMNNFKSRVLDISIKQINEHTDIVVSYEQHKQGRTITGFSFNFSIKQQRDPNTIDFLTNQNQMDSERFTRKRQVITKAHAETLAYPGEDYEALYQRLSRDYLIRN